MTEIIKKRVETNSKNEEEIVLSMKTWESNIYDGKIN